ncbi:MAG: hypothetical protein ACP5N7_03350 [Candidatus Pacearchaeota archaeon]
MEIKTTKDLFSNYRIVSTKTKRSERGDLITSFTERINQERIGTAYKPLRLSYIANLLSVYKTGDLYVLLKKCGEAKSFSKCFWYFARNLNSK